MRPYVLGFFHRVPSRISCAVAGMFKGHSDIVKNAAIVRRQQVPVVCVFSVALDHSMLGRGRAGSWNNSTVQIFDFYDLRSLDFYARQLHFVTFQ